MNKSVDSRQSVDSGRRLFMGRGLAGLGVSVMTCGLSSPVMAGVRSLAPASTSGRTLRNGSRELSFHNLHTDEKLHVVYYKDGGYDRSAWGQINHLLRDHYTGDQHPMDLHLMDLLHDTQGRLQNDRTIQIISGYRSPKTNARLRGGEGACTGVAKNSYHMRGMATDIRFDGTPLARLHDIALDMRRGGVGYYPSSDFVHMDVGPVRRWG
jgi:uncharacterized protein YcbK (DUF882 family)